MASSSLVPLAKRPKLPSFVYEHDPLLAFLQDIPKREKYKKAIELLFSQLLLVQENLSSITPQPTSSYQTPDLMYLETSYHECCVNLSHWDDYSHINPVPKQKKVKQRHSRNLPFVLFNGKKLNKLNIPEDSEDDNQIHWNDNNDSHSDSDTDDETDNYVEELSLPDCIKHECEDLQSLYTPVGGFPFGLSCDDYTKCRDAIREKMVNAPIPINSSIPTVIITTTTSEEGGGVGVGGRDTTLQKTNRRCIDAFDWDIEDVSHKIKMGVFFQKDKLVKHIVRGVRKETWDGSRTSVRTYLIKRIGDIILFDKTATTATPIDNSIDFDDNHLTIFWASMLENSYSDIEREFLKTITTKIERK